MTRFTCRDLSNPCSCQGAMGKWRRPRPRPQAVRARGASLLPFRLPARPSPCAPWARGLLLAFWERGSPDLPACGLRHGSKGAQHGPTSSTQTQDPREGPSLTGWTTRSFLRHGLISLAREEAERSRRGTSRGARDASHDDQGRQAGASPCNVLLSSLVQRGQAQPWSTEASGKGCHFGATRPRPGRLQDGGHRGAQDGVTTRALCRRRLLLSG